MKDPTHDPTPKPERIIHDIGSWISGGATTEQVRVVELQVGDELVKADGVIVIDKIRPYLDGWTITWHAERASGVFSVDAAERLTRVRKAVDDA